MKLESDSEHSSSMAQSGMSRLCIIKGTFVTDWSFSNSPGFNWWQLVRQCATGSPSNWWLPSGSALHFQPSTTFPAFLTAGALASRPWSECCHPVSLHQHTFSPHLWTRAKPGATLSAGGKPEGAWSVSTNQQRLPAGQWSLLLPSWGPWTKPHWFWGQNGNQTKSRG